jgi:hypothetical protein
MKYRVWDGRTFAVLDKKREPANGRDPFGMPRPTQVWVWVLVCAALLAGVFTGK